jgi:Ca-activated chloride channel family protein
MNRSTLVLLLLVAIPAYAQNAAIRKGNEYYRNGDFVVAETQYRNAGTPVALFNLANTLIQQQKYKEALSVLEGVATTTTDASLKASAFYNTGVIYSRQDDLARSIDAYKASLRIDPDAADARENLQKALLEQKRRAQERQKQQKQPSRLSRNEAERKLNDLQEKERRLQEKLQKARGGQGMEKDW